MGFNNQGVLQYRLNYNGWMFRVGGLSRWNFERVRGTVKSIGLK